mmetsp:Transcript_56064/g.117276  ORF Transcript_56064/g.117276 Transcript_56064/m.117276 type:complete len:89 (+) Transcript_56064:464-730(+)
MFDSCSVLLGGSNLNSFQSDVHENCDRAPNDTEFALHYHKACVFHNVCFPELGAFWRCSFKKKDPDSPRLKARILPGSLLKGALFKSN